MTTVSHLPFTFCVQFFCFFWARPIMYEMFRELITMFLFQNDIIHASGTVIDETLWIVSGWLCNWTRKLIQMVTSWRFGASYILTRVVINWVIDHRFKITVKSRYLELGFLEFFETQSVYLNRKYILIAFSNHNLALEASLQVQITRNAN